MNLETLATCLVSYMYTQCSDCCCLGFLAASICDNLLIQNRLYSGNSLLSIRPKYRYNNTFKLPTFFDSFYVFSDFQRRTSDPFRHFISATDSYSFVVNELSILLLSIAIRAKRIYIYETQPIALPLLRMRARGN